MASRGWVTHFIDIRFSVENYGRGLRGSSSMVEWDSHYYGRRAKGEQRQREDEEHIVSVLRCYINLNYLCVLQSSFHSYENLQKITRVVSSWVRLHTFIKRVGVATRKHTNTGWILDFWQLITSYSGLRALCPQDADDSHDISFEAGVGTVGALRVAPTSHMATVSYAGYHSPSIRPYHCRPHY